MLFIAGELDRPIAAIGTIVRNEGFCINIFLYIYEWYFKSAHMYEYRSSITMIGGYRKLQAIKPRPVEFRSRSPNYY